MVSEKIQLNLYLLITPPKRLGVISIPRRLWDRKQVDLNDPRLLANTINLY